MLRVNVSLPSGRSETLLLPELSTVEDLQILAQESFAQKFLRLVTAKNRALTNPTDSLQAAGIQEGEHLTAVVQQAKVASTAGAFAVWCCGGDRIVTWGHPQHGGDSSAIQGQLRRVEQVQATRTRPAWICEAAFAAILAHGSVVTWGNPQHGGDSSAVQGQLRNVRQIQATSSAFAAVLDNGSVVTWGHPQRGGDSSAVQGQLRNVQQIQATESAFAAVLDNGSVVTWGDPQRGGDSSAVQGHLRNVRQIQATVFAFAAVLDNGSVVTWGDPQRGGDSSAVQRQLRNVRQIQATAFAFAAVLDNGSVVTWGHPQRGGDSSAVQGQLRNVRQIQATAFAFAAVLDNGSVVTWADPQRGGDSSAVQGQLRNVQHIQATESAFAAVLDNGSVVTWGHPQSGGDSSAVQRQLRNVRQIQATAFAFAAVLDNGSVVTWGHPQRGGDSSAVQDLLQCLDEDPGAKILIFIGRWVKQKGVDHIAMLTPAFLRSHPEVQIILAGPPDDACGLYAGTLLDQLGDEFKGRLFVCTKFFRLPEELRRGAHLCFTPSCSEPFGYVDVEFGLLGVPSVGAAIGGLGKMPGVYFRQQNSDDSKSLIDSFFCSVDHALNLRLGFCKIGATASPLVSV
eukprot:s1570_g7.t1